MGLYSLRYPGFRVKALTLSYDDGQTHDIRVVDILNRYGIKGTFNLNGGRFDGKASRPKRADGSEYYLDAQQAKELYLPYGHEVACHTVTHPMPGQLADGGAVWEFAHDRETLEELTGTIVRGMAYPYGTPDERMVESARQCGLAYGRVTERTLGFSLPQDWLRWRPTCHHSEPKLETLCQRFLAANRPWQLQLFYLWGHSYEFADNDNWELLENFCKTMGGHEDIWYATNMEIYNYVNAARQLQTSMDGSRLYNPTATTIYLRTGGEDVVLRAGEENVIVPPGQTIKID